MFILFSECLSSCVDVICLSSLCYKYLCYKVIYVGEKGKMLDTLERFYIYRKAK